MTPVRKRHLLVLIGALATMLLAATVLGGCVVCQGHGGSASDPRIACGFRI